MIIRRTKTHAVNAYYQVLADGSLRLTRITRRVGPLPDAGHLLGAVYPDKGALRRAVLAAMAGEGGDTLDNVLLSKEAYEEYMAWAQDMARKLAVSDPSEISDERAKPNPDGSLTIWVETPKGRVEHTLPPGSWAWRNRPN